LAIGCLYRELTFSITSLKLENNLQLLEISLTAFLAVSEITAFSRILCLEKTQGSELDSLSLMNQEFFREEKAGFINQVKSAKMARKL
jgi:hypothetical protein